MFPLPNLLQTHTLQLQTLKEITLGRGRAHPGGGRGWGPAPSTSLWGWGSEVEGSMVSGSESESLLVSH